MPAVAVVVVVVVVVVVEGSMNFKTTPRSGRTRTVVPGAAEGAARVVCAPAPRVGIVVAPPGR